MKYTKKQIEDSRAWLLDALQPGMTIYTIMMHVSRSGESRDIRFLLLKTVNGEPHPTYLSRHVACVLGYKMSKKGNDGVRVPGVGMDMGFKVVYDLSRELFGPEPRPDTMLGGQLSDPGYALKQRGL